jgi:hypothetical protein
MFRRLPEAAIMTQRLACTVVLMAVLCAATARAQDENGCMAARYGAAAKYALCEARAVALESPDFFSLKCRQTYDAAWGKVGTKYPGTSCDVARFVDNGDGTITDNLTLLVWEGKDSLDGSTNVANPRDADNVYSWTSTTAAADGTAFSDFLNVVNSSGLAGQHDWRLPTLAELHTIIATDGVPCGTAPCVAHSTLLPTKADGYWTSSASLQEPTNAWYISFDTGSSTLNSKAASHLARAVRGGF